MAKDVIVRGDLIEYLDTQRCEACQRRGRDCIMKMGAETCLLCSDTGRPCNFDRSVRLRGPAHRFTWDVLLGKKNIIDLERNSLLNSEGSVPSIPADPWPNGNHMYMAPEALSRMNQQGIEIAEHWHRALSRSTWSDRFDNIQKLIRPWRRALIFVIAASSFREAGQRYARETPIKQTNTSSIQVFDTNMSHAKLRRPLSESERQSVAQKRKLGIVCYECRKKKVKCIHVPSDSIESLDATSTESPSRQGTINSRYPILPLSAKPVENASSEVRKEAKAQIPSLSAFYNATMSRNREANYERNDEGVWHLKTPEVKNHVQQKPPSEPSEARIAIPKASYARPPPDRIQCPDCNIHPQGYRGDHELQRHRAREHAPKRKVYVIVDASPDGKLFADCSQCRKGKFYNAYYNAGAHLRRKHFNEPRKGKGKSKLSTAERRGGKGSGTEPPMDMLKKYMKEIELDANDTRNALEGDDDNDASSLPPSAERRGASEEKEESILLSSSVQAA